MRPLLVAVLTLLLLPHGGHGQAVPAGPGSGDDELVALDRRLFETQILDQDPSLLLSMSGEEYTVVAPGGVIEPRAQVVAGLRAFATVDSISFEPVRVVHQGGTAVVFSRISIHGALAGPIGRLPKLTAMTVYTRAGAAGWTVASRALTPCDPRAEERGLC